MEEAQLRHKSLYRVQNWAEYNKALVERGSITVTRVPANVVLNLTIASASFFVSLQFMDFLPRNGKNLFLWAV